MEAPGGLFPNYEMAVCDRARLSKFAQLFDSPKGSDVVIITADGQEIKVVLLFCHSLSPSVECYADAAKLRCNQAEIC